MNVPSQQLVALVREVTSADPRLREHGADRVTDWVGSYSDAEGNVLSEVLAACASIEMDEPALESQVHALLELSAHGSVHAQSPTRLRTVAVRDPSRNLAEYIRDLLEET